MKYLSILVVVVLLGSNCIGQKMDSIFLKGVISVDDGVGLFKSTKQDTVRVLMLVCDTSRMTYDKGLFQMIYKTQYILNDSTRYEFVDVLPNVWWQFGYVVIKTYKRDGWWPLSYDPIDSILDHLDQNKKPLVKSIVIWMTKELD